MCRLLVYVGSTEVSLADLLVHPAHSIMKQSFACRERFTDGLSGLPSQLNADGFGIAWYQERRPGEVARSGDGVPEWETPGLYRSTAPAWNDLSMPRLCAKLSSKLVFGHIRAASLGTSVHTMNCHPFVHGRYTFMHNGHIAEFLAIKRDILGSLSDAALGMITGTTDSEHLFAMILTEVERQEAAAAGAGAAGGRGGPLTPQTLQACLVRALRRLQELLRRRGVVAPSMLNVCLTDGSTVLATRLTVPLDPVGRSASLYFSSGSAWAPRQPQQRRDAGAQSAAAVRTGELHGGSTAAAVPTVAAAGAIFRRPLTRGGSPPRVTPPLAPVSCAVSSSDGVASASSSGSGASGGEYEMTQGDRREGCVIVASERLTGREEDWMAVPADTLILVTPRPALTLLRVPLTGLLAVPDLAVGTVAGEGLLGEALVPSAPVGEAQSAIGLRLSSHGATLYKEGSLLAASGGTVWQRDPSMPHAPALCCADGPVFLRKRRAPNAGGRVVAGSLLAAGSLDATATHHVKRPRGGDSESELA